MVFLDHEVSREIKENGEPQESKARKVNVVMKGSKEIWVKKETEDFLVLWVSKASPDLKEPKAVKGLQARLALWGHLEKKGS